jgi:hypothetical protein
MTGQCCASDIGHLLVQINIICMLLALLGSAIIVKHPFWFGGVPVTVVQSVAGR